MTTVRANDDDSRTVIIVPNAGYRLKSVLADGNSVEWVQERDFFAYTFAADEASHALSVTFEEIPSSYTITATSQGSGSLSPSGAVIVEEGASQTFSIVPYAGYTANVFIDDVPYGSVASYTFDNVIGDHTISVTFELTVFSYAITATAEGNGSVTPYYATVEEGGSRTFTFAPYAGYELQDVLIDGVSQGLIASYTFDNVVANHTLHAIFTGDHIITVTLEGDGSVEPSGAVSVADGTDMTFTFTPVDGGSLTDVEVDDVSVFADVVDNTYEFTEVVADYTLHVVFEVVLPRYTITTEIEGEGTITPSEAQVAEGGNQTFTMEPAEGYALADVEVDGVSVGAVTTYTFADVTADATIKAFFEAVPTYTITAEAVGNGTITPSGEVVVNEGASQEFTITPADGYKLTYLEVDDVFLELRSTYTFADVTEDHTISVTFAETVTYTIKATSDGEGTITPSGEVVVNEGASKTFTMEPVAGYKVADVNVDGESEGAITSYTFEDVIAPHTIHVIFEEAIAEYLIKYDENKDDVTDVEIRLAMGTNVIRIENLQSIHPDDILVTEDKPENMLMGLVSFKVVLENTDNATAQVILDISEAAPAGAGWFMFSDETWSQLPVSNAVFSAGSDGGTLVTLTLTDGGIGDADGEVNGQILVYSGYGTVFVPPVTTEGSGSDNCFIATATNGSYPHNFGGNSSLMLMLMALIAGCAVSFFRRNRG